MNLVVGNILKAINVGAPQEEDELLNEDGDQVGVGEIALKVSSIFFCIKLIHYQFRLSYFLFAIAKKACSEGEGFTSKKGQICRNLQDSRS